MAGRPSLIPSADLHLCLPLDLKAKLDLKLFSELEGRVPKGGYRDFFVARTREWMESESLDLAPYVASGPQGLSVRGSPEAINLLRKLLET